MEISKIITKRRKELHMTQRELAEKLNVTDKTISRWEVGKSYPDATILPALAKVLNISIDELFGDTSKVDLSTSENDKVDYKQITKFRICCIISLALLITGFVILDTTNFIGNIDSIQWILLYAISFILIVGSIVLMVVGIVWYIAFYKEKFYTKIYKTIMIKWIISYVDIFVFILDLSSLYYFSLSLLLAIVIVLIAEITMVIMFEKHGYNLNQKDKKIFIISSLGAMVLLSLIFCFFVYFYVHPFFVVIILILFMIFEFIMTFKFYGYRAIIKE
jgi:transcriptional regulator with XRE-family HTH domain